jgi:DNA-binding transcriptional LysR family regulator
MDFKQLRGFIAVAEELHFGRAAERLHIQSTALSRLVRGLEAAIGVSLLQRTTRSVVLTRAGLGFLEHARGILARTEEAAQAARAIAEGGGGTIRIGAIDSASASLLPQALAVFRRQHPVADVRLSETMTGAQLQMLRTGRLDLALVRPPLGPAEFPFVPLRAERLVALLPQAHPLAQLPAISINDLRNMPMIIPAKRARPYAYDLVMAYFESAGAVPRIAQETTEKPAILGMVAAGHGVALVPDWMAMIRRPGTCYRQVTGVDLNPSPPGALVGMAWRPQQKHPLRDDLMSTLRAAAEAFPANLADHTEAKG